jgi:hypothetical protein
MPTSIFTPLKSRPAARISDPMAMAPPKTVPTVVPGRKRVKEEVAGLFMASA